MMHPRGLHDDHVEGAVYPADHGMPGLVREARRTITVDDHRGYEKAIPVLAGSGFRAAIVAPIWAQSRLAAVLVAGTRRSLVRVVTDRLRPLGEDHRLRSTHLGERFFRGGDVHTRTTRGLGLGLAMSAEILALHGSRLEIDSAPGRGPRSRSGCRSLTASRRSGVGRSVGPVPRLDRTGVSSRRSSAAVGSPSSRRPASSRS